MSWQCGGYNRALSHVGGARNSTVQYCNNAKKRKTYPIRVSEKEVGLVGSSADVCGSLCRVHVSDGLGGSVAASGGEAAVTCVYSPTTL